MRSGDPHKRSDHMITKSENQSDNIRTRSGDARVRSHDHTIVCNAEKQPQLPLTTSASSIEQQVTSKNDNSCYLIKVIQLVQSKLYHFSQYTL